MKLGNKWVIVGAVWNKQFNPNLSFSGTMAKHFFFFFLLLLLLLLLSVFLFLGLLNRIVAPPRPENQVVTGAPLVAFIWAVTKCPWFAAFWGDEFFPENWHFEAISHHKDPY